MENNNISGSTLYGIYLIGGSDGNTLKGNTITESGNLTVAGTTTLTMALEASGLKPELVRVRTTFLGGGFGRRIDVDFIAQAVEISKAVASIARTESRRLRQRPRALRAFRYCTRWPR